MFAFSRGSESHKDSQKFFETLYHQYKRLMYSTVKRYVSSLHDQEDIIQNALVRLIKKAETLYEMDCCALASYIVYTVRSSAIDYLRRNKRIAECFTNIDECDSDSFVQTTPSLDEYMITSEKLAELTSLWPSLSEEDRLLLEGKYIWGYTDKELALLLQCKPDSIRMKRTRARRKVLEALARKEAPGE